MKQNDYTSCPGEEDPEIAESAAILRVAGAMRKMGIPYTYIYVYLKTGVFFTAGEEDEWSTKDLERFNAAVNEYGEILQRKNNNRG